jgi:hypothetical protein
MVVDETGGLHEGVDDRRPDKAKASLAQILRERVRLRGAGGTVASVRRRFCSGLPRTNVHT